MKQRHYTTMSDIVKVTVPTSHDGTSVRLS